MVVGVGEGGLQLPGGGNRQVVGRGAVGGAAIVTDPDAIVGRVDGDADRTRHGTALEEHAGRTGGGVDLQNRRPGPGGAVLVAELGDEQVPGASRRSGGSAAPASGRNWPARTCSTASGCAARTAALTPAARPGPRPDPPASIARAAEVITAALAIAALVLPDVAVTEAS
jgi:hypothetical protein